MSFTGLPIDQRSYKRFAFLTPSDTTVIDPPPDALFLSGASGSIGFVGSDNVEVSMTLITSAPNIVPLSIKKLSSNTNVSVLALWRD